MYGTNTKKFKYQETTATEEVAPIQDVQTTNVHVSILQPVLLNHVYVVIQIFLWFENF